MKQIQFSMLALGALMPAAPLVAQQQSAPTVTLRGEPLIRGELGLAWRVDGVDIAWGQNLASGRLALVEPTLRQRQTPEDSAYRVAREILNRGEYRRAAELFGSFSGRFPESRYRDAASYWQAFALYRSGAEPDLRKSLSLLDETRRVSPKAAGDDDVNALLTRVLGALAARGDAGAAGRLRADASGADAACDSEELAVRAEALSALYQNDPAGATPVLRRILERKDQCSVPLRRRAVYLLGKDSEPSQVNEVLAIARNDPDASVRTDAISRLGQIPGEAASRALREFFQASNDESNQRAVVRALRSRDDAVASTLLRSVVQREDLADAVRVEAIRAIGAGPAQQIGQHVALTTTARARPAESRIPDADAAMLRQTYARSRSGNIRRAIVETMARSSGPEIDSWMAGLVRDLDEDMRVRSAALSRLGRPTVAVEELTRLYDGLSERELRSSLVRLLGEREEPAATDKLISIAKSGTDPRIRQTAISLLSKKKDPRIDKILAEIVEK
ncbi:MAG: HEAT repeat domain-containing protein [Gemmatimonadales bacterium]